MDKIECSLDDKATAEIAQLLGVSAEGEPAAVCEAILAKIKELVKPGKPDADAETELSALKLSLKEANEKLALSRKEAPEMDEDTAAMIESATKTELNSRVEKGLLTPAAREVAIGIMCGKSKGIFLSRKAATHAGLPEPIRDSIFKIIDANDPVKLAELTGKRTKSQVALSRTTPGGNEPDDEDKARMKRMQERAEAR